MKFDLIISNPCSNEAELREFEAVEMNGKTFAVIEKHPNYETRCFSADANTQGMKIETDFSFYLEVKKGDFICIVDKYHGGTPKRLYKKYRKLLAVDGEILTSWFVRGIHGGVVEVQKAFL